MKTPKSLFRLKRWFSNATREKLYYVRGSVRVSKKAAEEDSVCVAAIARDELPFVDEWLAYHRLLGVDHFFIYDDDPRLPLKKYLEPHKQYVTVIDWYEKYKKGPGFPARQAQAYDHAFFTLKPNYKWMALIDIDEFIVLREHPEIHSFLQEYDQAGAVSLHWHIFGNNGYFSDPRGLVTSSLTRRRRKKDNMVKTIHKFKAVSPKSSKEKICVHNYRLKWPYVQVNIEGRPMRSQNKIYIPASQKAHINHYYCRSFQRWMSRVKRGFAVEDTEHKWKYDEALCEQMFKEEVSVEWNEIRDEYMFRYQEPITAHLKNLGISERKIPEKERMIYHSDIDSY